MEIVLLEDVKALGKKGQPCKERDARSTQEPVRVPDGRETVLRLENDRRFLPDLKAACRFGSSDRYG